MNPLVAAFSAAASPAVPAPGPSGLAEGADSFTSGAGVAGFASTGGTAGWASDPGVAGFASVVFPGAAGAAADFAAGTAGAFLSDDCGGASTRGAGIS